MVIPATMPTLLSAASAPTRLLRPWDPATLLTQVTQFSDHKSYHEVWMAENAAL